MQRINLNTTYINNFTKIPSLKTCNNFVLNEQNIKNDINIVVEFLEKDIINSNRNNCLLWKSEPDNIYRINKKYIEKFGYFLSNRKREFFKNTKNILALSFTCFQSWIVDKKSIPEKKDNPLNFKNKNISVLTSNQMIFGTHPVRYNFIKYLQKNKINWIDILGFGKKVKMEDALRDYRYTIVLENTLEENHWTEKLSDALRMKCFIFYFGCKNINKYFDTRSIIRINIKNPRKALKNIKTHLENDSFERNIEAIEKNYDMITNLNIEKYLYKILKENDILNKEYNSYSYNISKIEDTRSKKIPWLALKYKYTYIHIWTKLIKIIRMKLSKKYKEKIEDNFNPIK